MTVTTDYRKGPEHSRDAVNEQSVQPVIAVDEFERKPHEEHNMEPETEVVPRSGMEVSYMEDHSQNGRKFEKTEGMPSLSAVPERIVNDQEEHLVSWTSRVKAIATSSGQYKDDVVDEEGLLHGRSGRRVVRSQSMIGREKEQELISLKRLVETMNNNRRSSELEIRKLRERLVEQQRQNEVLKNRIMRENQARMSSAGGLVPQRRRDFNPESESGDEGNERFQLRPHMMQRGVDDYPAVNIISVAVPKLKCTRSNYQIWLIRLERFIKQRNSSRNLCIWDDVMNIKEDERKLRCVKG